MVKFAYPRSRVSWVTPTAGHMHLRVTVDIKIFFFVFYLFLGFYNFYKYPNYITDSTCINIYYTTLLHKILNLKVLLQQNYVT